MKIFPPGNLYQALTAVLPLAGTRSLAEGQTTAELMVESSMAGALTGPVQSMYRYPFRNGITAVPETSSRDEIRAWLLTHYSQPEAAAELRVVLPPWSLRAFNVGGSLGLQEIGAHGVFNLQDAALRAEINSHTAGLTTLGGHHSVVDTTVNELTVKLSNGRLAGLADEELSARLAQYITARSAVRAGAISLDQVMVWVNEALRQVYRRNGISFELFKTRPEASQTGPCPLCTPYDGKRYAVGMGPGVPVHGRCVCVYLPDTTDWSLPDDVWRG